MKIKIINDGNLTWCMQVEGELASFYDTLYEHTPYGQFVSQYYVKTLLEHDENCGLVLDGGIPERQISPAGMKRIKAFLMGIIPENIKREGNIISDGKKYVTFDPVDKTSLPFMYRTKPFHYNGRWYKRQELVNMGMADEATAAIREVTT